MKVLNTNEIRQVSGGFFSFVGGMYSAAQGWDQHNTMIYGALGEAALATVMVAAKANSGIMTVIAAGMLGGAWGAIEGFLGYKLGNYLFGPTEAKAESVAS